MTHNNRKYAINIIRASLSECPDKIGEQSYFGMYGEKIEKSKGMLGRRTKPSIVDVSHNTTFLSWGSSFKNVLWLRCNNPSRKSTFQLT